MKYLPLLAVLNHLPLSAFASPLPADDAQSSASDVITLKSINYDCASAADGTTVDRHLQRRMWDELDVKSYLVDWFENKKPTLKLEDGSATSLFGLSQPGEKGPFFPEVFSASEIKNLKGVQWGDQMKCLWGECESMGCSHAKDIGLDARGMLDSCGMENGC